MAKARPSRPRPLMFWFTPITRSPAQGSACKDLRHNGQRPAIVPEATYTPIPNRAGSRSPKKRLFFIEAFAQFLLYVFGFGKLTSPTDIASARSTAAILALERAVTRACSRCLSIVRICSSKMTELRSTPSYLARKPT